MAVYLGDFWRNFSGDFWALVKIDSVNNRWILMRFYSDLMARAELMFWVPPSLLPAVYTMRPALSAAQYSLLPFLQNRNQIAVSNRLKIERKIIGQPLHK